MKVSFSDNNIEPNFCGLFKLNTHYTARQMEVVKWIDRELTQYLPKYKKTPLDIWERRGYDFLMLPAKNGSIALRACKNLKPSTRINRKRPPGTYIGTYNKENPFPLNDINRILKSKEGKVKSWFSDLFMRLF